MLEGQSTKPLSMEKSKPAPIEGAFKFTISKSSTKSTVFDSATAIVYCEGNFGKLDGKTANGLIRHSEKYKILSVIDSENAGCDSGSVLDQKPNGIPICRDLTDALAQIELIPNYFIFGMAPSTGMLSKHERGILLEAMSHGMNVVNGLHEFLNDDPVFVAASIASNVEIIDVRKPRDKKDLHLFSGKISEVTCPIIAVLGTDCAIGKRTTAHVISDSLSEAGIKTVMIGTGQTGLIQGARYGVALDAIPSQFCAGELENTIFEAFKEENPNLIVIEGQGALSHPAFSSSCFILRGACPDAVILQHAPKRKTRCDFENMEMPTPESEINLIQTFADTRVIGLTLNHEGMTELEVEKAIIQYERELGLLVTDALLCPPIRLVNMVLNAFPELDQSLARKS